VHPKYKKMVKKMEEIEKNLGPQPQQPWFLYILRCRNNTFYTGVTKDLERRLKMHNNGKASRYTRARRPVRMIYQELCGTRVQALVRECQVKELSRKEKERLILGVRKPLRTKGK
jgi:putative endonuclease